MFNFFRMTSALTAILVSVNFVYASTPRTCEEALLKVSALVSLGQPLLDSPPNLLITGTALDLCSVGLSTSEAAFLQATQSFCDSQTRRFSFGIVDDNLCQLDGLKLIIATRTQR